MMLQSGALQENRFPSRSLGTSHSCSKGTPKTMKIYGPFVTFEEATMAKGRYSVTPGAREPV
jgi:hypothetical protein